MRTVWFIAFVLALRVDGDKRTMLERKNRAEEAAVGGRPSSTELVTKRSQAAPLRLFAVEALTVTLRYSSIQKTYSEGFSSGEQVRHKERAAVDRMRGA